MMLDNLTLTLGPRDLVFSDFDATISLEDTGLAMMRHLSPERNALAWELEHRWRAGEIDSMKCLAEQWALIDWSEAELLSFIDALPIDPAFDDFARRVQALGTRLVIVSDGLDLYVHRILRREGFETCDGPTSPFSPLPSTEGGQGGRKPSAASPSPPVERGPGGEVAFLPPPPQPGSDQMLVGRRERGAGGVRQTSRGGEAQIAVYANHAEITDHGLVITFPYGDEACSDCGNCKRKHLRDLRRLYERVIYIGDGFSDRCASQEADILFAKSHLAEMCEAEGRDFVPFESFADILARIV
jgi:2-hydroxy-3-keto-5-methylthiopentenyl-1-phosphate phosphatase